MNYALTGPGKYQIEQLQNAERIPAVCSLAELTRLKTIERQALALLVNKGDLGMYSIREPLMADLEKAFGPYDPKQHKVKYP